MKSRYFFIFSLFLGCWQAPALDESYPFSDVGSIYLQAIHDYKHFTGSGEILRNSITPSFMKMGYDVIEPQEGETKIIVGNGNKQLGFTCIISDYTDREVMVIPYRSEDRGYAETTMTQSSETKKDETSKTQVSSSSTSHGGAVQAGSRLEYIRARVGIMLKLHDPSTGQLVWSHHYGYSGLDLAQTADMCARLALHEFRKIF